MLSPDFQNELSPSKPIVPMDAKQDAFCEGVGARLRVKAEQKVSCEASTFFHYPFNLPLRFFLFYNFAPIFLFLSSCNCKFKLNPPSLIIQLNWDQCQAPLLFFA